MSRTLIIGAKIVLVLLAYAETINAQHSVRKFGLGNTAIVSSNCDLGQQIPECSVTVFNTDETTGLIAIAKAAAIQDSNKHTDEVIAQTQTKVEGLINDLPPAVLRAIKEEVKDELRTEIENEVLAKLEQEIKNGKLNVAPATAGAKRVQRPKGL